MNSYLGRVGKLLLLCTSSGRPQKSKSTHECQCILDNRKHSHDCTKIGLTNDRPIEASSNTHRQGTSLSPTCSKQSQPITIDSANSWLARNVPGESIQAAPQNDIPDGANVRSRRNMVNEPMPSLPDIVQPVKSMRDITNAPGTCRWNHITGCWMNIDHNSSKGTWGHFKDKRRMLRPALNSSIADQGLIVTDPEPATTNATTKVKGETCLQEKPLSRAAHRYQRPDDAVARKQPGPAFNPVNHFLEELRRLAAENETAVESYPSSPAGCVVTRVDIERCPSVRP